MKALELTDILPGEMGIQVGKEKEEPAISISKPSTDTKFEMLLEILKHINEEESDAKVIIFTFFLGTSRYLAERLNHEGFPALPRIGGRRSLTPASARSRRTWPKDPSI